MSKRQVICVDTETNGLDPAKHEAWEIAWYNLATAKAGHYFVPLDTPDFMSNADLDALRINRFIDRYPRTPPNPVNPSGPSALWTQLEGNTLAGSNPSFDAAMLRKHFTDIGRGLGENPAPWHHRMWDLSAYAAGVLALDELPGLAKVCELLNIPPGDHTAEADVTATALCFRELQRRAVR